MRQPGTAPSSSDSPLTSVDQLAADLACGTAPILLDIRWKLGEPSEYGHGVYLKGHIPGARYVSLDQDLAEHPDSPVGARGRHPLPDRERFAAAMRHAGVRADLPVVVYDDGDGTQAARAWWLLRHHGHAEVRVLDGGFAAWRAAGRTVEEGEPEAEAAEGDFEASGDGVFTVLDHDGAAAVAADGTLLDARAGARYRGETEPIDPAAGHVPGAVSAPTTENLGADGRFLPSEALAERFAGLGVEAGHAGAVAVYCGSGVTATHEILAMAVAGIDPEGVALYEGSWSGWASDPSRAVATGEG
ncbi:Rhodanese domain protein [Catenulispora acidiphila DSM 44928]|uniref:Rhodanese domain protein n=1 Tax=Catenulispora acidiphila (strain DSM 44928 / JCM 14897 / NBRC 102108 / NRRL B-24433 / ID139908) TaxID=479433 RepID=C7QCY7_CATAD|nr:sulfurtransferase [Catenulispora acidiphila]ACU70697.1 Rhodanese domain protein [Catenulispora acidiphila DSM 44928]